MITRFALVCSSFFFLLSLAEASPARKGIAINAATKECAEYWGGDECTEYQLPAGWKDYYSTSGSDDAGASARLIITELGTCSSFNTYQDCCTALGLTYLDKTIGIAKDRNTDAACGNGCSAAPAGARDLVTALPPVLLGIFLLMLLGYKLRPTGA